MKKLEDRLRWFGRSGSGEAARGGRRRPRTRAASVSLAFAVLAVFALAMAFSPAVARAASSTRGFQDVGGGDWVVKEGWLGQAVDAKLMSGLNPKDHGGRKLFDPYGAVTRGQVATVLYRMAGSPQRFKAPARDFSDNRSKGAYYYQAVRWANSVGVVTGLKDSSGRYTRFAPGYRIWRQDLCVMSMRFVRNVAKRSVNTSQAKAQRLRGWAWVSGYARDAVGWAVNEGVLSGVRYGYADRGDLQANQTCDRSMLAKVSVLVRRAAYASRPSKTSSHSVLGTVLAQYRSADARYGGQTTDANDVRARYPLVNPYVFWWDLANSSPRYAYVDITGDGVDDLVIGKYTGMGSPGEEAGSMRVLAAYSVQNGRPVKLLEGTSRGNYQLCWYGVIKNFAYDGQMAYTTQYYRFDRNTLARQRIEYLKLDSDIYMQNATVTHAYDGISRTVKEPRIAGGASRTYDAVRTQMARRYPLKTDVAWYWL